MNDFQSDFFVLLVIELDLMDVIRNFKDGLSGKKIIIGGVLCHINDMEFPNCYYCFCYNKEK